MVTTLPSSDTGNPTSERGDLALPIGTLLGEFEVIGLVGEGGFGIVYLAQDHQLGRRVALKEYMPSVMASRGSDGSVSIKSEKHLETFETGLRSFVNEARLLASFDHPALVKVFRFWEANGTAYMVMPYYQGQTLKAVLKDSQTPPDENWLKRLLWPICEALELIHSTQCYHRDIAPDNIMILESGQPVLLDFGAARRVIGDMTQALTVILKPGFAPVEQYADSPEMKQGPWTDIYALAAVTYFAAAQKAVIPSVSRMMSDTLEPMHIATGGRYSPQFCAAVDQGLAVRAEGRPQSVGAFSTLLGLTGPTTQQHPSALPVTGLGPAAGTADASNTIPPEWDSLDLSIPKSGPVTGASTEPSTDFSEHGSEDLDKTVLYAPPRATPPPPDNPLFADIPVDASRIEPSIARTTVAAPEPTGIQAMAPLSIDDIIPPSASTPSASAASKKSGNKAVPAVLVVSFLAAAAAAGYWYWQGEQGRTELASLDGPTLGTEAAGQATQLSRAEPSDSNSRESNPSRNIDTQINNDPVVDDPVVKVPQTKPDIDAGPEPEPIEQEAAQPDAEVSENPESTTKVPAPKPVAPIPFSAGTVIDSVYRDRQVSWVIQAWSTATRLKIGEGVLSVKVSSKRGGYLYLLMRGTDPSQFYLLFPNEIDSDNRIAPGQTITIPREGSELIATGPAGVSRLLAVVAPSPRDFKPAGAKPMPPFKIFDMGLANAAYQKFGSSVFAGWPLDCPESQAECAIYGAAKLDIEEVN